MNVHELVADMERHVHEGARVGTRHRAQGLVTAGPTTHAVVVAARIDPTGRRRDQYFCDDVRVPLQVLLRLTCAETECPQALAVRAQWRQFHRRGNSGPTCRNPGSPPLRPPFSEFEIVAAGHRCIARSAQFNCFGPCPNHAHPPLWIVKSGFDLFEEGVCVGGGVSTTDGISRPRLPSVEAAKAYLLARQLEASAILGAVAAGLG